MDTSTISSTLRQIVSGLHKGLRKQITPASTYSMTELETIVHLYRNEQLLPTELAALTRVKTQSMSQILKKLEEHGVIARNPSEKDKRKIHISLTSSGKKLVEDTRYERDEWLKELIEKTLTKEEQELLASALPILSKLLENN